MSRTFVDMSLQVWMLLHDEAPCFAPRELRPSLLLAHYGYDARRAVSRGSSWTTVFSR